MSKDRALQGVVRQLRERAAQLRGTFHGYFESQQRERDRIVAQTLDEVADIIHQETLLGEAHHDGQER